MLAAALRTFWGVAVLGLLVLIWIFKGVLLPFVLGGTIAYLLNPVVNRLTKAGLGRQGAVLFILGLFFVFVTAILAVISPILFREALGFAESAPAYLRKIWESAEPYILTIQERFGYSITADQIQGVLQDNIGKALQISKGVIGGLTSGGVAVIDFLTTLLITPVAAFFLMRDWPQVTAWAAGLIPRYHLGIVTDIVGKIDGKISGFVRGQMMVCLALGFIYAVALTTIGLNYGFVIGLAAGVLSIIPFVGSAVGLVTGVSIAFLQTSGDLTFVGVVAVCFMIGQFIEGNFITPKVMGDSVGLHPLWIVFALMAGGSLLGLLGMFLSIPVAASVGVLAGFAISEYKTSPYYKINSETPSDGTVPPTAP